MKVISLQMRNFRSFSNSGRIELGPMNVLIGANNSGKSSVLRALHQIQLGLDNEFGDVREGNPAAEVRIQLVDVPASRGWGGVAAGEHITYVATIKSDNRRSGNWHGETFDERNQRLASGDLRARNVEPHHFIVPYWSKRKSVQYDEDIREQNVMQVAPDVRNLAAKLSRLANPAFPKHEAYSKACRAILGFEVTAIPSVNGQRPGVYLPNQSTIPIEQMGEGVPNIVQMLAHLATAEGKLFLVEEPENDLHPTALRLMLDLIVLSSESNQFVVSTHSNIVVRQLCGSSNSRLFRVTSPAGVLPVDSRVEGVPPTPEARIDVLRELGYSFSDFDLWDGWLILEESSAERIVRDYLVPWFVPKLARVRCVAANGVNRVEPLVDDFLRIVVFTHLQPAYRNKTWIRVDNDDAGQAVAEKLKAKFSDWQNDRIATLQYNNFEHFYPAHFTERVHAVLAIQDKGRRRDAKKELLREVVLWLDADSERGKIALRASAATLIRDLETVATQI